jgi:hypothetical protein
MLEQPYTNDKSFRISKSRLINEPLRLRPHVVILGAGASVAAFPEGDTNGKGLPTMENLVDVVGLQQILDDFGIDYQDKNFEALYSEIHKTNPQSTILSHIEEAVHNYFAGLQLPGKPTLYDHLLFSLRPKDIVATFNWDPFLYDAWERNRYRVPLPDIAHLHGNVRIGYCTEHQIQGKNDMYCPECRKKFTPSRLLYPVATKNYSDDSFISGEWKLIEHGLREAFAITVFGYGAPRTDKDAVKLMEKAWKEKSNRQIETSEFIDIKESAVIREQWKAFIYSHHYLHFKNFYESWIPNHSRRSCEALYVPTILGRFVEGYPLPRELGFDDLLSWLEPLIKAEQQLTKEV